MCPCRVAGVCIKCLIQQAYMAQVQPVAVQCALDSSSETASISARWPPVSCTAG